MALCQGRLDNAPGKVAHAGSRLHGLPHLLLLLLPLRRTRRVAIPSAEWQQEDMLSIIASDEVGEQGLAFPSEDVESDKQLGLAQFPLVEASIAALVQAPNLALLTKNAICPTGTPELKH
ncbi:UNVERIFIED_CONTAM: hypothetical protein FKN15_063839 [Acipenser sinensis]